MNYGIQMYSLRDSTKQDLDGTLRAVAEMGYRTVEFAGFFGHRANTVRDMLNKYNLICIGTHSLFDDLLNNFDETVEYHKALCNTRYIVPGYDLTTKEKLDTFILQCNELAPKLREHGIELGYHNHHHEFIEQPGGYTIHNELEKRCDIFFEIDTYWAFVAKQDPVATLERLGNRVKMIHLKDGTPEGRGYSLGSGSAPVAAVREKAIEMGLDIVVESEGCEPTGKEEVERCINYLKTLDSDN